jgi:hypothetical protein
MCRELRPRPELAGGVPILGVAAPAPTMTRRWLVTEMVAPVSAYADPTIARVQQLVAAVRDQPHRDRGERPLAEILKRAERISHSAGFARIVLAMLRA